MSNHVNEWLNAYLDGELKGRQLQQVEEHLAECELCQSELEALQGVSALLQEVPAPEFVSHERSVAQVNLRLSQRRSVSSPNRSLFDAGWWMIPVTLLLVWVFIGTTTVISEAVSAANRFGLLDQTMTSLISTPADTADVTSTLGTFGILQGNNLQWAERSESFTKNVLPQLILYVSVAVLYLAWFAIWWVRHTRQVNGQLLEG